MHNTPTSSQSLNFIMI
uniref:Uncharacterized protein n=1 Tax=Rhizophora mucronata TaxID=61149 RepID=A0A2P2QWF9_RHIMU